MRSTSKLLSHPTTTPCTRTHQIGALALISITFFITRLLNQSSTSFSAVDRFESNGVRFFDYDGVIRWPNRGYGLNIDFKIYVYDENEIDGIKMLLYGRDGKISPESCVKGQWGTQVT